jgi:hypothetical protein
MKFKELKTSTIILSSYGKDRYGNQITRREEVTLERLTGSLSGDRFVSPEIEESCEEKPEFLEGFQIIDKDKEKVLVLHQTITRRYSPEKIEYKRANQLIELRKGEIKRVSKEFFYELDDLETI